MPEKLPPLIIKKTQEPENLGETLLKKVEQAEEEIAQTLNQSSRRENDCTLRNDTDIGNYRIIKLLSNNGICETYLVRHKLTSTVYILKLFPPGATGDEGFVERFKRMKNTVPSRFHPHIVLTKSLEHESVFIDYYYMIVDYIQPQPDEPLTLKEKIEQQGKMRGVDIRKMLYQICDALSYAHEFKDGPFYHSDLKPSNILIDRTGNVKLSDFETISILGRDYLWDVIKAVFKPKENEESMFSDTQLNQTTTIKISTSKVFFSHVQSLAHELPLLKNMKLFRKRKRIRQNPELPVNEDSIIETYDYMSPEQKSGKAPSVESNIYSLGLIIYLMLTGEKYTVYNPLPSQKGCVGEWDNIVTRCLNKDPLQRFHSIQELRNAVNELHHTGKIIISILSGLILLTILSIVVALSIQSFSSSNQPEQEKNLLQEITDQTPTTQKAYTQTIFKVKPQNTVVEIISNGKKLYTFTSSDTDKVYYLPPGTYIVSAQQPNHIPLKEILEVQENVTARFNASLPQIDNNVKQYQDSISGLPESGRLWKVPGLQGYEMIPAPTGTFLIEIPGHPSKMISFDQNFWIGKYEISQTCYEEIMWKTPSFFKLTGLNAPVERISIRHIKAFCDRLNLKEKNAGRLPAGYKYRLPTESEWEYCCRAGSSYTATYGKQSSTLLDFGWLPDNSERRTHASGTRKPNKWGIYDMFGNVWEWCVYPVDAIEADDYYVLRGGSWKAGIVEINSLPGRLKIQTTTHMESNTGFRIVLAPELENPFPGISPEDALPELPHQE